jgi:hypothetical protein
MLITAQINGKTWMLGTSILYFYWIFILINLYVNHEASLYEVLIL